MKNARIFLVLLLIVSIVALAGCARTEQDRLTPDVDRITTEPGIVNDEKNGTTTTDGAILNQ